MIDEINKLQKKRQLVSICRDQIDDRKIQGFILASSNQLVLLQYVYDFNLDALLVLRNSDITDIYSNKTNRFQTQLMKNEKIYQQVNFDVSYNIRDWSRALSSLGMQYQYVILEDETPPDPLFLIGKLLKVNKKSVSIRYFSGAGNWDSEPTRMDFASISCIQMNTNYINMYKKYFETKQIKQRK